MEEDGSNKSEDGQKSADSSSSKTPQEDTLSIKTTVSDLENLKIKTSNSKINILLKPVGDAPILKQKLWAVDPEKQVASIINFTKNYLRLDSEQSLFFFVNQAFAPSPDQSIRNLYECFGSDNKLTLYYSTTVAWG